MKLDHFIRTLAIGSMSLAAPAAAATLTATFTFDKRSPEVGVIYLPEDLGNNTTQPVVDQKSKDFMEQLVLGPKGSTILLKNSDEIAHNIYADDIETNVKFDIGLADPKSQHELPLSWDEGVFAKIGCKIHPKMRAWIGSLRSQYFTVMKFEDRTEATFKLINFPEQYSKVRLWLSSSFDSFETVVSSGPPVIHPITKKGKAAGSVSFTRQ